MGYFFLIRYSELPGVFSCVHTCVMEINVACKQALLFGRVKRVSRERANEGRGLSRERANEGRGLSLARSREVRFACPNRRACSQAKVNVLFGPVRGTVGATEQSKKSSARKRFCSIQVVNRESDDFSSDWLMKCGVRFY